MEPTDEDLCRRVAGGEPGAFDCLVERFEKRAFRIAWGILRDHEAAKDCSQEAFLRLHEGAGSFSGQSKFSTWFYRIVANVCLDHRRRARGWRQLLAWRDADPGRNEDGDLIERLPAPAADPGDALDAERRLSHLWCAVETLSPQLRATVLLACREGLATREIAAVLGLSEATVRVHLHRAFATLRRRVGGAS